MTLVIISAAPGFLYLDNDLPVINDASNHGSQYFLYSGSLKKTREYRVEE